MRDESDLRLQAEPADMARAHQRQFRDFGGRRVMPDVSVGEKKGALVGDHQAHRGKIGCARNQPDNVIDVTQP